MNNDKNEIEENNMEWYQTATIVAANLGLFLWTVRQSRTDYLHCQRSIETFKDAMLKETKEFHVKLAMQDHEFKFHMIQHHKPRSDP